MALKTHGGGGASGGMGVVAVPPGGSPAARHSAAHLDARGLGLLARRLQLLALRGGGEGPASPGVDPCSVRAR